MFVQLISAILPTSSYLHFKNLADSCIKFLIFYRNSFGGPLTIKLQSSTFDAITDSTEWFHVRYHTYLLRIFSIFNIELPSFKTFSYLNKAPNDYQYQ